MVSQRYKKKQQRKSEGATVAHSFSWVSDGEADKWGEEEKRDLHRKEDPVQRIDHSRADLFAD